ncbi:MBL fold metallo-hydrolase [Bacillus aerolatus]|uniref:MBL fold metallo-hydrolase n=1 Tax=Bacillus aerolatus TaxID=2653354 RepID=A0A6I1FFM4_9BACI|nr:MBL fold metallo-hydrolase [Bacillus aerolatus]KAB7704101.1 MBL fold metallo-hydrolase [Bacillus aerolatus]
MVRSETIIKVLGTAQDGGVPQPNCFCSNCKDALKNPLKKRLAASLGILLPELKKWYLIDATPDFKDQLNMINAEHHEPQELSGIFLTHAHIGHYPGLIFLGKEAMSAQSLPVFTGEKMHRMLKENAPWNQLIELNNIEIHPLLPNQHPTLNVDFEITPISVPHRNELSETFGFIISGPNKKVLYIPDIDRWEDWEHSIAEMASNVDYCLLDATFYSSDELKRLGRNYKEIPHPYIEETMDLLQEVVDQKKCDVYFLHFNHTNPIINSESPEYKDLVKRGFKAAREGMEFIL